MNLRFALTLGLALAAGAATPGCGDRETALVVYASQDQVYAEPILAQFTEETGIRTRPVFDTEATKTAALANRLEREQRRPQADVFWNNEEFRTRQLARRGVLAKPPSWRAFGYRTRRIVANTNLVSIAETPARLEDLVRPEWSGRIAMAYPMFGSTSTHFLALRDHWGPDKWERWCRGLAANQPLIVDGNSVVVQIVGRGERAIGLTDVDDVRAGQRNGLPIDSKTIEDAGYWIPNTISVVANAPHPEAAAQFMAFLTSDRVVARLVEANALEGATRPETGAGIAPQWERVLDDERQSREQLANWFFRSRPSDSRTP